MADHTQEAESAAPLPCPECRNEYLAIRTDIYKDQREFVYCDCCGCISVRSVWNEIRRAVPADTGVEDSCGITLPPLPEPVDTIAAEDGFGVIGSQDVYTAEQICQAQREAREYERKVQGKIIARRDAEIEKLRAELASRGAAQGRPTSIDTPEFRELISAILNGYWDAEPQVAALIAYIDAWGAQMVSTAVSGLTAEVQELQRERAYLCRGFGQLTTQVMELTSEAEERRTAITPAPGKEE